MIAFHRSGAVRIAVLFLALFACTVVAAFAMTYMLVRGEIMAHLQANIVAGADATADRLLHEQPDVVFSSSSRQRVSALFNADGSLVFGEAGLSPFLGWREFPADNVGLQEEPEYRSMTVLAYGRQVGDRILVVAEGMDIVEDSREALTSGLLWSSCVCPDGRIGRCRVDRLAGRSAARAHAGRADRLCVRGHGAPAADHRLRR